MLVLGILVCGPGTGGRHGLNWFQSTSAAVRCHFPWMLLSCWTPLCPSPPGLSGLKVAVALIVVVPSLRVSQAGNEIHQGFAFDSFSVSTVGSRRPWCGLEQLIVNQAVLYNQPYVITRCFPNTLQLDGVGPVACTVTCHLGHIISAGDTHTVNVGMVGLIDAFTAQLGGKKHHSHAGVGH